MTPGRWERIKELFDAALELPPEKRPEFLAGACGEDGSVRQEVERVLDEHDRAGSFLEDPVWDALSNLAARDAARIFQVAEIVAGRFRIVRFIGRGGMGEVYEVEDLDLGEPIALKTLRPHIAAGERYFEALRREVHHARRVTHPNVNRIFDLERHRNSQADEVSFLTMELLKGETLAERLRRAGPMPAAQALPLIEQMAGGLDAAHGAGIVHRDFKPGNVMLVPSRQADGAARAVITDFGLARGVDTPATGELSAGSATGAFGTPPYAAPEQFEAGPITPAADIYAFGAVIREMVLPDVDPKWQRAIGRCLERNPVERFAHASEVVRALRRPLASGRKWPMWILALAGLLSAVAILLVRSSPDAEAGVANPVALTHDGFEKAGLWLRDQTLFFDAKDGERTTIMRVPIQGGGARSITSASAGVVLLDVSPDGSDLLVRQDRATCPCPFFILPAAGGPLRNFAGLSGTTAAWSPDGGSLAYASGQKLYITGPDGMGLRELVSLPYGDAWDLRWSPDGRRLRVVIHYPKRWFSDRLYEVDLRQAMAVQLLQGWSRQPQDFEDGGRWTPKGDFFVFFAVHNGTKGIWAIRERDSLLRPGEPAPFRLVEDPEGVCCPTFSEDGRKLFVLWTGPNRGELWRYDRKADNFFVWPERPGLSAGQVSFSPDGREAAYVSYPETNLWKMNVDGTGRQQLTSGASGAAMPQWSPDGRDIAYMGSTVGSNQPTKIRILSAAGGQPREPVDWSGWQGIPTWTPDGGALIFGENGPVNPISDSCRLHRYNFKSGKVEDLPNTNGLWTARMCPTGRYIAAETRDSRKLMLYDLRTARYRDLASFEDNVLGSNPAWSKDGKFVYIDTRSASDPAIYRIRIADKHVERVASLKGIQRAQAAITGWLGLTPDGSPLIVRQVQGSEIYAWDWVAP
jgi:Tol biopolymer transport system component